MTGLRSSVAAAAAPSARERIARAFARSAHSYDQHADLQRAVADQLLALLPKPITATQLLDLGCGTGYCTQQLRTLAPAATVLAVDLAEPMLQRARTTRAVLPLCADAQQLPLQAASIDLLVSSLTIQWCADAAALFAELQRVLRPGGTALLSTLGPQSLHELRVAWSGIDQRMHSNRFTALASLEQAAMANGFTLDCTRELRTRHYSSLRALAHELKGLGANAVLEQQASAVSPASFRAAEAAFARNRKAAGIPVQWEVFYLQLRKAA